MRGPAGFITVSDINSCLEAARSNLAAGLFNDALLALGKGFEPQTPEHCVVMAEALWRTGQVKQAAVLLERCDRASPREVRCRALELCALISKEEGRPKQALELLDECSELSTEAGDHKQLCRAELAKFGVLLD